MQLQDQRTSHDAIDAIIIGGGPGGSTCAAVIAKAGHRVLLLERETFPRYQIGESLLPATVHGIAALLDVKDELEAACFTRKRGGTFRWGQNPRPWTFTFGQSKRNDEDGYEYAYQVERAKFDDILLRNAAKHGAEVRERATVEGLIHEDGRVVGVKVTQEGRTESLRARFVVDATGHQSRFHEQVGERLFSKHFRNIAIFGYFTGGARLPAPNDGNIFCEAFQHGWFWYIPLSPDLTSVGVVVAQEKFADVRHENLEQTLMDLVAQSTHIREHLKFATRVTEGMYGKIRVRKDYSYCNTRFWRPGLALVGDAACFVDPVFSSGVHLATYGGLLAGRAVNSTLSDPERETTWFDAFEARYQREYRAFYDFLVGFYDMGKTEDSYFWNARSVLGSEESGNEAFLRLVAGNGTTGAFHLRAKAAKTLDSLFGVAVEGPTLLEKAVSVAKALFHFVGSDKALLSSMKATGTVAAVEVSEIDGPRSDDDVRVSQDGLHWRI